VATAAAIAEIAAPVRRRRHIDPVIVGASVLIGALVVVALLAPWISPYDPNSANILATNQGVSAAHWLGTDPSGRDVLSRLIWGARLSLLGPALIILIATTLGTVLAIASAWIGGLFDQVVSRVMDILFAFPGLVLAMVAVAMFGSGPIAPVVALSIAYTPYITRILRSASLRERNLPYISACYVGGVPARSICSRHLLPNIFPLLLTQAALSFGSALVTLAAVSYLGLGVQPPTATWGLMVATGQTAILAGHPGASIASGILIIVTVVAFNLLGDRLANRHAVQGL
jgi:peptide/nickel transport system permease protein